MLEAFLQGDLPHPDHMPAAAQMVQSIREILLEGTEGRYDVDAVLFTLAMAVFQLENVVLNVKTDVLNLKSQALNLEARILESGIRLKPQ